MTRKKSAEPGIGTKKWFEALLREERQALAEMKKRNATPEQTASLEEQIRDSENRIKNWSD